MSQTIALFSAEEISERWRCRESAVGLASDSTYISNRASKEYRRRIDSGFQAA